MRKKKSIFYLSKVSNSFFKNAKKHYIQSKIDKKQSDTPCDLTTQPASDSSESIRKLEFLTLEKSTSILKDIASIITFLSSVLIAIFFKEFGNVQYIIAILSIVIFILLSSTLLEHFLGCIDILITTDSKLSTSNSEYNNYNQVLSISKSLCIIGFFFIISMYLTDYINSNSDIKFLIFLTLGSLSLILFSRNILILAKSITCNYSINKSYFHLASFATFFIISFVLLFIFMSISIYYLIDNSNLWAFLFSFMNLYMFFASLLLFAYKSYQSHF